MLDDNILSKAQSGFSITGPPVKEAVIDAALPYLFPGKSDVVQFYLRVNGGSRTRQGGTLYGTIPAHEVTRDHLDKIRTEGFYSICQNAEEKVPGFRSMLKLRALFSRKSSPYPQLKAFVDTHMPIAFDRCGNDFWIDLVTGRIDYMLLHSMQEGPIDIASSFKDFVLRFWIDQLEPFVD